MSMTATKTAAPPLYLTLTLVVSDDGSAFVPADAVAGQLGGAVEFVLNRAQAHKVPFGLGPFGEDGGLGFDLADAVRLIRRVRADMDDHSSKWQAYVAHRAAKKQEAHDKRMAEAAVAREEERRRQLKMAKRMSEEAERKAQEEAARRAAEQAVREGDVPPFEKWKAS